MQFDVTFRMAVAFIWGHLVEKGELLCYNAYIEERILYPLPAVFYRT